MSNFKNFFKPSFNEQVITVLKSLDVMLKEFLSIEENKNRKISVAVITVPNLNRRGFCFMENGNVVSDVIHVYNDDVIYTVARKLGMKN